MPRRSPVLWLAAALAIALGARLATLAAFPLVDPTEGRYAEIPREMVASGDWVMPRLDPAKPFWGKPPLAFWATAESYRWFGVNEFAARFPALVFSALTCLVTGWLGARLFGPATGVLAALVLATSALFFVVAGAVLVDPALTLTTTLAAAALLASGSEPRRGRRGALAYAGFASVGLSVLAKGFIGPALLVLVAAVWACTGAQARARLRALPWVGGTLVALAVALPWHLAAELETPGFLEYYVVGEHLHRFVDGHWESLYGRVHEKFPGAIWPYFLAATLPWSLVVGWRLVRERAWRARELPRDPELRFLVIWTFAPLVLFTFTRALLITYALPSLPPFALLAAYALRSRAGEREPGAPPVPLAFAAVVPVAFVALALVLIPRLAAERSQKALVDVFERACSERDRGRCELVYLREEPGADFYTGGRAIEVPKGAPVDAERILDGEATRYLAIRPRDRGFLPAALFERTELLGRFGDYELRREGVG